MYLIGLIGGVAGGKSFVAEQMAALGAGVLDADRAGHAVLRLPHIEEAAMNRWGGFVFGPDGHVHRPALAKIVFANNPKAVEERRFLEQLTHAEITQRLMQEKSELEAQGIPAAVLDAPLLLEAGWDTLLERLVFVDAPRSVRLARALARGWTEADFSAREDAQESLDRKRARADVVVDNSGSREHTLAQIEQFWHTLFG
jgi:dephospho-CoA kinase